MAQKQVNKDYSVKPDQLFAVAVDAVMKLGYSILQQNKNDGFISFKTGMTMSSFTGIEVSAIISDTSSGSRIAFGGGTAAAGGQAGHQAFSIGGSGSMNRTAEKVLKIIDERVQKGDVPPHKPSANAAAAVSPADELKKLAELLSQGILTQAEFDAKKKQLLGL